MARTDILAGLFCMLVGVIFTTQFQSAHAQTKGDIRLAGPGSNASQGRVEIFNDGLWGTVCDDTFEREEAFVVCRQLGFTPTGAQFTTKFGQGSGPIWMDDLRCEATGLRLEDCLFGGWNRSDCSHDEDVGVICRTSSVTAIPPVVTTTTPAPVVPDPGNCTTPDPTVRLARPSNLVGLGVVQIFKNNQWGNICDNDWDMNDARVICGMLCYNRDDALAGAPPFQMGNITDAMMVKSMECTGFEASIHNCTQSNWQANSCLPTEKATVTCVQLDNSAPSKPEPVLTCTNGLLTASFSRLRDQYLQMKHLTVANTYQGECNVQHKNVTDYVSISIPFDECGTVRTYNSTHITYTNVIRYAPTHSTGDVSNSNTYMVHVKCELPRTINANKPILPLTETVTQTAPGKFVVNMHFFRDNKFQNEETQFPMQIPLGQFLSSAVSLLDVDNNLRLIVPDCYATPTSDPDDPVKYPLFTNKCADDPTVGFFSINSTWFGYRYQTFKFTQFTEVYIHCNAVICGKDEQNQECDRSCFPSVTTSPAPGNRRNKRSASHPVIRVSSQSIVMYDPNASAEIIRPDIIPTTPVTRLTSKADNSVHSSTQGNNTTKTPTSGDNKTTKGGNPATQPISTSDNILRVTTAENTMTGDTGPLPAGDLLLSLNGSRSLKSFTGMTFIVYIAVVVPFFV